MLFTVVHFRISIGSRVTLIFFYFLFSIASLQAQGVSGIADTVSAEPSSTERNLSILTWNLHLMPAVMVNKNQKGRAKGIAQVLAASTYDVIVFQEAFHKRARKLIWTVLSEYFPYEYGPRSGGFINFSAVFG